MLFMRFEISTALLASASLCLTARAQHADSVRVTAPVAPVARAARRVGAIAIDGNGNVYAGGTFVNTGGDPKASHLVKWDGTAWRPFCNRIDALDESAFNGNVTALQIIGKMKDYLSIKSGDTSTPAGAKAKFANDYNARKFKDVIAEITAENVELKKTLLD